MGIDCHPYLGLYTIPQYSIFGVSVKDAGGTSYSKRMWHEYSIQIFGVLAGIKTGALFT